MADEVAFHAHVRGLVQMVGFRWFTVAAAEKRGVRGWVRNCADGSVEVEAVGSPEAIDEFLRDLHDGPRAARVNAVDITWLEIPPEHPDFAIHD